MPAVRLGGAIVQPIFHPVRLKVFPRLDITTVRSRIPGSVEIDTGGSSNQISSYTSSEITRQSAARATDAMPSSSARVRTRPVGLCGLFTRIALVRGPTARRRSSSGNAKSGARSRTVRTVPPAIATHAGYES